MGCIILSPSCSRLQIEPKKLCPSYAQTIAAQRMPTDLGCDASTHSVQNECEHEAKELPTLVNWFKRRRSLMNFQA